MLAERKHTKVSSMLTSEISINFQQTLIQYPGQSPEISIPNTVENNLLIA